MPTIDVDRDTAHEAAVRELAKAVYPRASLTERFAEWVSDLLYRTMLSGSQVPGGWFTIAVLALLGLAGLVVAVRIGRNTIRTRGGPRLYSGQARSAAEHRVRAEHAAAQRDWAGAIRHRLRAVGRQLEEDGVLGSLPGRTAGELAREAGSALPGLRGGLLRSAEVFNDVTYGGRPGTEDGYLVVVALDDRIRRSAARPDAEPGPAAEQWTPVR